MGNGMWGMLSSKAFFTILVLISGMALPLLGSPIQQAFAHTAISNTATTAVDATPGAPPAGWKQVDRALTSDDDCAQSSTVDAILLVSGFGFAIPAGSIINNIVVEVEYVSNDNAASSLNIKLLKAGAPVGSSKSIVQPVQSTNCAAGTFIASSPADLWGTSWSAAEINDSGFGVEIENGSTGAKKVDSIRITIDYTPVVTVTASITASETTSTTTTVTATATTTTTPVITTTTTPVITTTTTPVITTTTTTVPVVTITSTVVDAPTTVTTTVTMAVTSETTITLTSTSEVTETTTETVTTTTTETVTETT